MRRREKLSEAQGARRWENDEEEIAGDRRGQQAETQKQEHDHDYKGDAPLSLHSNEQRI